MLKTTQDNTLWLVSQTDHSHLAGYFAAHWGNREFARPGHYLSPTPVIDSERLRAECVLAIAEHDNGWWEWEATPELSIDDGYPAGLVEALQNQQASMQRFRLGLSRFPSHPLLRLLISSHGYLFYAPRALEKSDPAFTHPLYWKSIPDKFASSSLEGTLAFMKELELVQVRCIELLKRDSHTAAWAVPETLQPLQRLMQLCDGISLWLCSALMPPAAGIARGIGDDAFELHQVPRRAWNDRQTIKVTPMGGRRVRFDPYPFDVEPLPVMLPARTVQLPAKCPSHFYASWHALQKEMIEFTFVA